MELHGLYRQIPVSDAHDDPVIAARGYFKDGRKSFRDCVERMVAANTKTLRQAFENPTPGMLNP